MAGGVFISYRREDSGGFAGRIYDRLVSQLGREHVFCDVDPIAHGIDVVDVASDRVSKCDALVVLISPHWIRTPDENGRRRLDDPADLVRIEIEAALKQGVQILPVLLDGAAMPSSEDLPDSLKTLARRQGVEISHDRFNSDVERVLSWLEEAGRKRDPAETGPAAREWPERRAVIKPPKNAEQQTKEKTTRKAGHLFISYCNEDEGEARSLVDDLERCGPQCWFASRDVQFNYQKEIVEAIRCAVALIVVISERANSSDEIPKEISLARRYDVRAIPVRIEDTWPSGALEYELSNAQNVDLFKGRDAAISRLIRLLGPQEAAEVEAIAREHDRQEPDEAARPEEAKPPAETRGATGAKDETQKSANEKREAETSPTPVDEGRTGRWQASLKLLTRNWRVTFEVVSLTLVLGVGGVATLFVLRDGSQQPDPTAIANAAGVNAFEKSGTP